MHRPLLPNFEIFAPIKLQLARPSSTFHIHIDILSYNLTYMAIPGLVVPLLGENDLTIDIFTFLLLTQVYFDYAIY